MGIFASVLVLSFLIFFHELGHFLAARFFGVHVEVFSIGFGTKVFKKIFGKTEYCISLIPLGGYVQMKGQDDRDPTKVSFDPDSYTIQAPWKRIIILFAGPFANFLLAFLLFIATGTMGITKFSPIVGQIGESSPALVSGIMTNDRIVSINDSMIQTWDDVSRAIQASEGALRVKVEREGLVHTLVVEPKISAYQNMFKETRYKKMIGIAPSTQTMNVRYAGSELLAFAWDQTVQSTTLIVKGLEKFIVGEVPMKELGGVITIVKVTSEASDAGLVVLLGLTALISVNLGVLNLLPIPALDGGHIMFNFYELVTKRVPSERVLATMTTAGWMVLLSLMALSLFNDIYRLTNGN